MFDESGLNPSLIKCHSHNTQFLQHGQSSSSSSLPSTASVQSWVTLGANLSGSFFRLGSIWRSSSSITELRNTSRLQNRPFFSGGLLQPRLPCGCALHSTRHGEPSTTSLDSAFSEHIHQAYSSTRLKQTLCLTFISEQMQFTMCS